MKVLKETKMLTQEKNTENRNYLWTRSLGVLKAFWASSSDTRALDLQTVYMWEDGPERPPWLYSMYFHMFGMRPGSKEEHILLTSHRGTHERTWWTCTTGPQSRQHAGPRAAGLEMHRTRAHAHGRVAKIDSQCHCGTPRTPLVHQRSPGWVVWWWTGLKTLKRFCTMACCIPARFPWWIPSHHEGKGRMSQHGCCRGTAARCSCMFLRQHDALGKHTSNRWFLRMIAP